MDKIRILLADDHIVVREGIRRFLDREDDLGMVRKQKELLNNCART